MKREPESLRVEERPGGRRTSWWIDADRKDFTAKARAELPQMQQVKFGKAHVKLFDPELR